MKILRHELLKVGDVVLTTTPAFKSGVIRFATKSDISHAMLYVDTCSVIDATNEGVHARNTQRILFDDARSVHVLRLKQSLKPSDARGICEYVRHRIGTAYAKREAVQTVLGGSDVWSRKQFCSRLVAQAFASRGFGIVTDPNYCSPGDILRSNLLQEIGDCTRPATSEDIEFAKSVDLTQAMRNATNAYIAGARRIVSDILDENDIDRHLLSHPEDDSHIHAALRASGYLGVWQMDVDQAPWHYDLELMEAISEEDGLKVYCRTTVADDGEARYRLTQNARGYATLANQTGLSTFEELAALYAHLFKLHLTRLQVAAEWLAKHDPDASAPVVNMPHSEEWFAELSAQDPTKAQLTRTALSIAGNENGCSICGDDPADTYRLKGSYLPAQTVPTLRLCEDCLKIRALMGEVFEPIDGGN